MKPVIPSRWSSWRRWLVLAGAVLIAALLWSTDWTGRKTVTLNVGGQTRQVHTRAHTVQDVLDDERILIDPEDVIQPDPASPVTRSMTITVVKASAVALQLDDEVRRVRTQAVMPLDVLAEQTVPVGPYDRVLVNGHEYSQDELISWTGPVTSIRVVRSVDITVTDGCKVMTVHTTQADVARALDAAGVQLYLADRVIPDFSTPITPGLAIRIERSVPLTVIADGQRLKTRARGPTVGDALAQIGLAPLGLDYTLPPLDTPLTSGLTIRLVRVTEETSP